ncbi:hypothetical protein KJ786_02545 [Patescibacteria group bacterium]|nr:hypothetical protein [Patescibacteria group bacterium]
MVWLFGQIKKLFEKRKLRKNLAFLMKKALSEKTAAQIFLRLFVETKNLDIQKNVFKKLRKLFPQLSFNDVYPILAPDKIKEGYKKDLWKMVLSLGIDWSDLLCITLYSDFFFAKEAFAELLKNYNKRRISKDRMKRFLIEIMTRRLEFVMEGWQVLKSMDLSYDDICSIKNSPNYNSNIFDSMRNDIQKIFENLSKNRERTEKIIEGIHTTTANLEKLE